jgi:hypothetical protein
MKDMGKVGFLCTKPVMKTTRLPMEKQAVDIYTRKRPMCRSSRTTSPNVKFCVEQHDLHSRLFEGMVYHPLSPFDLILFELVCDCCCSCKFMSFGSGWL